MRQLYKATSIGRKGEPCMKTPTPEKVQCDDAERWLSRNLDGDLTRAETRQLHLHLASCESCRMSMGQMAMLASDLVELNRQYAGQSLRATCAEKVRDAVRRVESEQPVQVLPSRLAYQPTRFHVHGVQFSSAYDHVIWTLSWSGSCATAAGRPLQNLRKLPLARA